MTGKHWNENDLLDAIYGAGRTDGHLEDCAECRAKWAELRAKRAGMLAARAEAAELIPHAFLAAQRRSIYHRLGERVRHWTSVRLASAAAVLAMLVIGVFLYRPEALVRVGGPGGVSDAQLVNEVASMVDSPLPPSIEPVRNLFEED